MLLGLAAKSGEAIMAIYGQREELAHSIKGDNSPLTTADLASNAMLLEGLAADSGALGRECQPIRPWGLLDCVLGG